MAEYKTQPTKKRFHLVDRRALPPTQWPLGLTTKTHSGADGLVRVVTVKTATITLTRPVIRLIKFPTEIELDAFCQKQSTSTTAGEEKRAGLCDSALCCRMRIIPWSSPPTPIQVEAQILGPRFCVCGHGTQYFDPFGTHCITYGAKSSGRFWRQQ